MATSVRAAADGSPPPAPPAPRPARRRKAPSAWRSKLYRLDVKATPYTFIAPFFLTFAAFGLFPLIYTGWLSLHRVELGGDAEWRGLENYTGLADSDFFWNALANTFTIGVISTVPQLLMALGLAHLLNYKLRGRGFYRVAILAPYATSIAAATLVFAQLFNTDYGMINGFLGLFGIDPVNWETEKWPAQIAISTIVTWRWTGYNALIYLAAMQAVPNDLYEAAALDGASRWRQFISVTIPSIRPTILFTIVVSTIGATQLFGEPLIFGGSLGIGGGSANQYQTLSLLMYEKGWVTGSLGQASAIAWVMLLLLLFVGGAQALISRRNRKKTGAPS
ncbi:MULTISPECIES: carbohydrate ABC transporter permease [Streptomyces]|uniref:Sugar ABC transporter permease n=2 Tax=Streptomyces TaxID=1883 RepID=A0A3R7EIJ1_9ACTN|nr:MULTISPECIES: sugar ABC transporter permease [Streptomyces]KNE80056.1 ABC transporter permease [Streptomyces fradiae]OFA47769.1 ABC transporter permease [Streptomyces fradiae]PQM21919.1 sugar ABC transporter permease [Streptomyces xinghaiensis]RKM90119.1 sugar ABC transporter permease [Streptomyces xinghaiensis]RNC68293.1 sugar ABC transporter permease [Streptomyces xinghaiensis]